MATQQQNETAGIVDGWDQWSRAQQQLVEAARVYYDTWAGNYDGATKAYRVAAIVWSVVDEFLGSGGRRRNYVVADRALLHDHILASEILAEAGLMVTAWISERAALPSE